VATSAFVSFGKPRSSEPDSQPEKLSADTLGEPDGVNVVLLADVADLVDEADFRYEKDVVGILDHRRLAAPGFDDGGIAPLDEWCVHLVEVCESAGWLPSMIISGTPPTRVAMTGVPVAWASRTTRGNPSVWEGNASRSNAW
jgi:hypothetical protein